jgi:hypothetical protein
VSHAGDCWAALAELRTYRMDALYDLDEKSVTDGVKITP